MMAKNHPPMGVVLRVWWSMGWRQAAGIVAASLVFGVFGLFGGGSFETGAGAGIALVSIPLMLWDYPRGTSRSRAWGKGREGQSYP